MSASSGQLVVLQDGGIVFFHLSQAKTLWMFYPWMKNADMKIILKFSEIHILPWVYLKVARSLPELQFSDTYWYLVKNPSCSTAKVQTLKQREGLHSYLKQTLSFVDLVDGVRAQDFC